MNNINKTCICLAVIFCLAQATCFASANKSWFQRLKEDLCDGLSESLFETESQAGKDADARYQAQARDMTDEERALDAFMVGLIDGTRRASILYENCITCPGKSLNRCSRNPKSNYDFQQKQSKRCACCTIACCALCAGGLAASACGCNTAATGLWMATKVFSGAGLVAINMPGKLPEQMGMSMPEPEAARRPLQ